MKILTWNMHKGRDARRKVVPLARLAEAISATGADVVLLQEVFHGAAEHAEPQSTVLATLLGMQAAYVPNARYARGHHGNAILARRAFSLMRHEDLSTNRLEKRGLLYVHLETPGAPRLHVINTHLGLNTLQRRRQIGSIASFILTHLPHGEPWLLGGDFNDWTSGLDAYICKLLNADNLLAGRTWRARCTYPVRKPWMPLDRLYARGWDAREARVLSGLPWTELSDHLPILARLDWPAADG